MMSASAYPRESGDPALGQTLDARFRGHERKKRAVKLCAPEVQVDRRADGTIYLKSGRTYGAEEGQALGLSHYLVGDGE